MDMKQGGSNSYFDVERLCNEAVERNFRGDPNSVGSVISQATYDLVWHTFVNWCQGQAEVGRAVNMPQFGIVGFQQVRDSVRILYVKLSEHFMANFQLGYKPEMAEFEREASNVVMEPLTKPNFANMAKLAQLDKTVFTNVLQNIFHVIGELLSENGIVEIDLQEFGKFFATNRQVLYDPLNKLKPQAPQGKQTVKALMDYGVSGNAQQNYYSEQQQFVQQQQMEYYASQGRSQPVQGSLGIQGDSPPRRYKKPFGDGKITKDLLGAGDDPMAKNQEYSLLANNPMALMKQTFKKPGKAVSRYPPVIDAFSRTLAAPISSERHYFSICHKIGTNFSPSAKGFFIDTEARVIKYKSLDGGNTKLDIVGSGDGMGAVVEPADGQEEYEALLHPQNADPRRIQARKVSYARYRQYVENEISVDVIAPIRQYWLTHIIELIPGDLHAVEKERIEYLIDTMLNEINKDYFDSVRKSILDYILKNEAEMKRLGIQQVLSQPIDWGDDYYKGIEPNEEWKHNVMMARMLMSENLCICSQATLELMKLWQDYKSFLFVNLPAAREEPVPMLDFLQQQENQMNHVKGRLSSDWNKSAVDILREELENLDNDQSKTFFESVSTLMANQVRELIAQSVTRYVDFIQGFKADTYPLPAEIITREYDPDSPFEDSFISLTLKFDDKQGGSTGKIAFSDPLDSVQSDLEEIVDKIVKQSSNIPRPENTIARSDKSHLWDVGPEDEIVIKAKALISVTLQDNLEVVKLAANVYDDYLFILQEKDRIDAFLTNGTLQRSRDEIQTEIERYQDTITKIRAEMPFEIRTNMFLIKCGELNSALVEECESLIDTLLAKAAGHVFETLAPDISASIKQIQEELTVKSGSSEDLVGLEKRLEEVKNNEHKRLNTTYADMIEWFMFLNQNPKYKMLEENFKPIHSAFKAMGWIPTAIEKAENKLKQERTDIENGLMSQMRSFVAKIEETKQLVHAFKDEINTKKNKNFVTRIEALQATLKYLVKEQKQVHEQQADLDIPLGEYPLIEELTLYIKDFSDLWILHVEFTAKMKSWEDDKINQLDPEEIETTVKTMMSQSQNLAGRFEAKKLPKPRDVAGGMKEKLLKFRPSLPIIRALCNPGLEQRHKRQLAITLFGESGKTGPDGPEPREQFDPSQQTVKGLLGSVEAKSGGTGWASVKDNLEEISDTASKEWGNKKTMNKMTEEWSKLSFEPMVCAGKDYKEDKANAISKPQHILNGDAIEEIQNALDDHIIKTQTMKGSPFAKFMLDKIGIWENKLIKTQDNLDLWLKVQATWMYLEPVFSSDDIISQMPTEGKLFKEVNKAWFNMMNRIVEDPSALTVIDIEDLGTILKKANERLEKVQKGLNDYLESKRTLFPRFYFLSNEELLEILSETKEPLKVQPHLKKCFEGIASLDFDDEKKIHGMYSIEGELVQFVRVIDPIASKGKVEDWLVQVEEVMLKSVRDRIEKAHHDYTKTPRDKWVIAWQGQAVLAIACTYWTVHAEEAMKKSGLPGLNQYYQKLIDQLNETVQVVRTEITKLQRCTLEALIVLDVHARDVIKDELIEKQICDSNDFRWLAQLRYYWEDNDIWARIINCKLDYNYEYLGNSARLVITALTDRCYRTLCGAIYLNYGGAPEGPAGTGKTETVKDLSKALARQCIVFNCSDGLDYVIMGKFFKGLSSCGAWSCFDEFNRIELEVLSVIAQQVQSIQYAIDHKMERFIFEDCDIPIKPTCNCFITMNPGYAGRSELPDNLKALFRSVAMMVPDYALIAEISLYSFGFTDAKTLSLKIVTVYKLCSEQLSTQFHYDYGMRAVKSVLTAAGNLKRRFMNENESILMLRAINDVNLAKFLAHDLPLFQNITSDLFPGVVLPEPDYKDLVRCMKCVMDKMNLQYHPYMILKTIQLYEMIIVRHGLMIVGLPFAGKTCCLKVLAGALSQLKEEGLMEECKTHVQFVNPKSVTMGQLYGNFDEVSHDWSDGILAVEYRTMAASMSTEDRRWLIFDGPVDAIWIENMNTVLDDNKKLCLMSGEVISMSANMNMIFEPMDLAAASPATVSRCGMVYLQPHEMGWEHLYASWRNTLYTAHGEKGQEQKTYWLEEDQLKVIDQLVKVVVQPCLDFLRKECVEQAPTEDQCLVVALLRILKALLKVFDDGGHSECDKKQKSSIIESAFVFAATWSLCCTVNTEYRRPFNQRFKDICNGDVQGQTVKFKGKILPAEFDKPGLIYDWRFLPEVPAWKNWMEFTDKDKLDQFPKGAVVQELIVTTMDTIRYGYLLEMFIMADIRTLFVGPTGTGKTAYIQKCLGSTLSPEKFLIIEVGFSARTHCNQVQDIVDGKLDKRRKDHFGPRFGMRCVVFVDDLNMPKPEKYKAQPPIEILRQFLDQGGWYDRRDTKHPFRNIVDTMLVAAMGTPGGGRSFITPRFQRHFNVVAFTNFDDAAMTTIFRSILKWFFRSGGFVPEVANMEQKLVSATLKVYDKIQADLKPTPAKTHYTFNLRDFSKVICGICLTTKKEVTSQDTTIRLWAHECCRIFGDRLINNSDRMWMLDTVREISRNPFGANFDTLFAHLDTDKDGKVKSLDEFRGLLFGDIMAAYGMADRPYQEILDKEKLVKAADDALAQYNLLSDKPMDLVLFNFAIEHLLRIGRIIKQPAGHALLVGVGGSGRQSLSRLASKIADFDVFQVEIKKVYRMAEWREDVKTLMRGVGGKGAPTTFLFTDTQIKEEGFLEDVNNILNTGEVPNIFPAEEKVDVQEMMRKPAKEEDRCEEGTPAQLFAFFLERCKKCLHVVLCFSSIGSSLRNRIKDFPSIVNCTTIDWFSLWPPDALESVALRFLGDVEMPDEVRSACVNMVQGFHTSTEEKAEQFKNELRRVYYVTPTSYLELINTFKSLLAEKRTEIAALRDRYSNGYDCLVDTESKVNSMQAELSALQPVLVEENAKASEQLIVVAREAEAANKIADAIAIEEAAARKIADNCEAIKKDCEEQLAEAMPALKAAQEAVNCIKKGDIAELKAIAVPHKDVLSVLSVVCMLFGVAPIREMNPETQKKEEKYWKPAIGMMMDNKFLPKLIEYDKENLTQAQIDKINPYIIKETFEIDHLKKISSVAMYLAKWVFAMDKFYRVNLIVIPKKKELEKANGELAEVTKVLKVKQASLKIEMDKVAKLKAELKATQDKVKTLTDQAEDCEARLIKAESLIGGLGGEKTRWKAESERLVVVYENLTGDVLISAGMIAYLGAFTSLYRSDLAADWVKHCQEKDIPNSGRFSLERVLGNPVDIRNWSLQGLPNDSFSVENAIINQYTRRWPLFIDPQGQANRWIKSKFKENGIKVLKFTDNTYLKYLEGGIRMGTPIMMENVSEDLDPAIEPLLSKQIVVKGKSMTIKIGDSVIDYDKNFKFFMATKLRNPHYLPEVSTKVTLINFMITFEGLSDQLLGLVVEKEQPELQTKKEQLVLEGAQNKNKLQEIEDQILGTLKNTTDILGDAEGIQILDNARIISEDINKKQVIAEKTEKEIDEARIGYQPVAVRSSGLFFCISDLANIDPMYQYSLDFFKALFTTAIQNAERSEDLDERLANLNKEFLESLYRNICRSLFEKDKLTFSMLLNIKLMEMNQEMSRTQLLFFLTGGVSLGEELPANPTTWLSEKLWGELNRLTKVEGYERFLPHFTKHHEKYRDMYDRIDPQNFQVPEDMQHLSRFQFLLLVRVIRPDMSTVAVSDFVEFKIGPYFISPPGFDLGVVFRDSGPATPLIFVLSPGADPLASLEKYAESKKKACMKISLGQGQGGKAEKLIDEGVKKGSWVVLQNCHLAVSWMGRLEKLCEELPARKPLHREFRLWLTSYPSTAFPVAVLQNGVKMTNEPPMGLKANLLGSYGTHPISDKAWFEQSAHPKVFRKLLFGLCFFHAFIQERRLFGPLGWNIQYQFNESDLRISAKQLTIFIDEYPDKVPLDALNYLCGECNYGGRVTDDKDRTLMEVVLKQFYCEEIYADDNYKFSPSGIYFAPKLGDYDHYINFIKELPQYPEPEIFGFHENAAITKNQNSTTLMLATILTTQQSGGGGGGGSGSDEQIKKLADKMLGEIPQQFDLDQAEKLYPISYTQSMNTVLTQELGRFNGLIQIIRSSLKDLLRAIKGEVLMSSDLEQAFNNLLVGQVPEMWIEKSFPSLKPLGGYIADLLERLEWFKEWVATGLPKVLWITRFHFTQGFLTGTKQNYARKYKIAIDLLDYDFEIVQDEEKAWDNPPDDGINIIGPYIEGCKWDHENQRLEESDPKVLYVKCPMVWYKPCKTDEFSQHKTYACPMYKTSVRKGVLMTTGHSTNFVIKMRIPTKKEEEHWIMRGAALLLSLDD